MKLFFGVILSFVGLFLMVANGLFGYKMFTNPKSWIVNTINTTDVLEVLIYNDSVKILFDVDPEIEFNCIDYNYYCDNNDCLDFFKTIKPGNSYRVMGPSVVKRRKYCDYCFEEENACKNYYNYRLYISVIVYVITSIITLVISFTLFILANNPKDMKVHIIDESDDDSIPTPKVYIRRNTEGFPRQVRQVKETRVIPKEKGESNKTIKSDKTENSEQSFDSNETVVGSH
jgi:hypothetical protein